MAYKFQLGKHKLANSASIDLTGTDVDIDLGLKQVDADNMSVDASQFQRSKLKLQFDNSGDNAADGTADGNIDFMVASKLYRITISADADSAGFATGNGDRAKKALTYNGKPANGDTLKISYNSVNYTITFKTGTDADSAAFGAALSGSRTADIFLSTGGGAKTADVLYTKVASLFNALEDFDCTNADGGDSNDAGTITWEGRNGSEVMVPWTGAGSDANNAPPANGVDSQSTTAPNPFLAKVDRDGETIADLMASIKSVMEAGVADSFSGANRTNKSYNIIVGSDNKSLEIESQSFESATDFSAVSETVGNALASATATAYVQKKSFLMATDDVIANTSLEDVKTTLASSAFTTLSAGQLDVDDIRLDGGTISTTPANGNLVLSPDGTGVVNLPSQYGGRAGIGDDSVMPKSYIDGVAQGLDIKASVKAASVSGVSAGEDLNGFGYQASNSEPDTLTMGQALNQNALGVFDGEKISAVGDRILIKNFLDTNRVRNGIYEVKRLPIVVRSGLTITRAGNSGDNCDENDRGNIDFIVNQKLFRITFQDNNSGGSNGFTSGTGLPAKKTLTYSARPGADETLKFSYDGKNYVATFKSSGSSSGAWAVSGAQRTANILIGGNADATYDVLRGLINGEAGLSCILNPAANNDDDGSIEIESENFKEFVAWGGNDNNALPSTGVASSSTVAASPFLLTVGAANNVTQATLATELVDALNDNAAGLTNKSGKQFVATVESSKDVKIAENRQTNVFEAVPFTIAGVGASAVPSGASLSLQTADVSTHGILQRSVLKEEDGGLSNDAEPMTPGSFVFIEAGATQSDQGFVMSSNDALVPSNDKNIEFTQFSGAGMATLSSIGLGSITAGQVSASEAIVVDANLDLVHASAHIRHMNVMSLREEVQVIDSGTGSSLSIDSGAIVIMRFGTDNSGNNRIQADYTLKLPASLPAGCVVKIKRNDEQTNTHDLTISRADGANNLIDGEVSFKLDSDFAAVSLISDGTDYFII